MIYSQETAPMLGIFNSMAFVLGCCIGSFMNVVVWRLPRGESLTHPPSHCPKCGHAIRPWENIPIISWLCLRARCSSCHLPISVKYPVGEAATGLLFTAIWGGIYMRNLPLEILPSYFFLGGALLAVALIDAEHWFIPNEVTYSGMLFALAMAALFPDARLELSRGTVVFHGFCALLERCIGVHVMEYPLLAALVDAVLGCAMGFALLTAFAFACRPLFGRCGRKFDRPVEMLVSREGIRMGDDFEEWDGVLDDITDVCILHGNVVGEGKSCRNVSSVKANSAGFSVDGAYSAWKDGQVLDFKATRMATHRDVIGRGDVKLLAMCGAFLGADAAVCVLLAGALLGLLWALASACVRKRFSSSLPFGPFLALACLAWVLFGNVCRFIG